MTTYCKNSCVIVCAQFVIVPACLGVNASSDDGLLPLEALALCVIYCRQYHFVQMADVARSLLETISRKGHVGQQPADDEDKLAQEDVMAWSQKVYT